MPDRATALTAAAGEHYVAYRLSRHGLPVALTRGGSPTVDLMVGDLSGNAAVSIQVKTASYARRKRAGPPERSQWFWDVGRKALNLRGRNIFYAFVNLSGPNNNEPEVFVVPSEFVANRLKPDCSRCMFWIEQDEKEQFYEKWDYIRDRLRAEQ